MDIGLTYRSIGQNTLSHLRIPSGQLRKYFKIRGILRLRVKVFGNLPIFLGKACKSVFFLVRYWIGPVAGTKDPNSYDVIKTWADNINQKLSKYGIFPQGPEAEKVMQRLKELKVKYDPENVFHQNVNIDPKKE